MKSLFYIYENSYLSIFSSFTVQNRINESRTIGKDSQWKPLTKHPFNEEQSEGVTSLSFFCRKHAPQGAVKFVQQRIDVLFVI